MQPKLKLYFVTIIILLVFGLFAPNAAASLRQHQESPGVMRYHSQVSIKDKSGHAWQVILYKVKNSGTSEDINLRLVGFPNVTKFVHPQSLEVITAPDEVLIAPDVYAQGSPAPNVGEYKFTNLLNQLLTIKGLKLNLPLQGEGSKTLKIPKNIVTEWQMLITEFE